MKALLMTHFFIMLFALITSAHAQTRVVGGIGGDNGGPKQSWQDIYKNPNLKPIFPTHNIKGRDIRFNHLCLVGERVRTKYKQAITNEKDFSKITYDYLTVDRVREIEECANYAYDGICIEWRNFTIEIPLHSSIEVKKKISEGDTTVWEHAFDKEFELKGCD